MLKIKFWWAFNKTLQAFRVNCILQVGKLSNCCLFQIRIWPFFNKSRNWVKCFIFWSTVEPLLKITFWCNVNETFNVFRGKCFLQKFAVYCNLDLRIFFNKQCNCVKTLILGSDWKMLFKIKFWWTFIQALQDYRVSCIL